LAEGKAAGGLELYLIRLTGPGPNLVRGIARLD
jgi:hypothetical protein